MLEYVSRWINYRVYSDIHKIENGIYPLWTTPTEHELAEIYDVSRETRRT